MSDTSEQLAEPVSTSAPSPFAERFSDGLQSILQKMLGTYRPSSRRVKSFLNGTWFGHPLHPAVTDVPVMGWVLTAIFDIIWLFSHTNWAAYGAFVSVIVGLLGAVASLVTGLTDWSDTYGAERRIGLNHALFNSLATVLYLVSFVLRWVAGPGDTILAFILGLLGLASVSYASFLGGEMVFGKGTGVNHTAWEAAGEDYEVAMAEADVEENKLYRVTITGVPVVLLKQGTTYSAIAATCAHAGGPLDEGSLNGDIVECPWHGSRFCMRDGRVLTGPATVNAPRYNIRITDGQIMLKRVDTH